MRKNRIIAMLMTVMLLAGSLGFMGTVQAAETEAPEVVISAVNVTDNGTAAGSPTGYLEVSLLVRAKDFQTAGVVLSYDTNVLTAVDWNTPANAPTLTENWTTVIPTKGVDDVSGKPALARLEEKAATPEGSEDEETAPEESARRGYLYFGAESLRYQELGPDATRLVTVRFAIGEKSEGVYKPVSVPGDGDLLTDASKTLCLAPEAVAEAAIPGAQAMLTLGEQVEEDDAELNQDALDGYILKYYAWRTTTANYEANKETACKVSFETKPGATVNTGTTQAGGDYAITFFDWDGRAIDAIAVAPGSVRTSVSAWEDANQARLTNKRGYAFDQWLVVYENNDGNGLVTKNDTFTSNNTRLATTNPDVANLDNLFKEDVKSVFLQAAYVAKSAETGFTEDLVNGAGLNVPATEQFYTISEPTYTRYGQASASAGSYSMTFTVTRSRNMGGNQVCGVTRLREPAVWVSMTPASGGANILSQIKLENTDETTYEIVAPKDVSRVSFKIIDVYGMSNWPGCADKSDPTAAKDRNTYVQQGTEGYLAQQAYNVKHGIQADWETFVDAQTFADCYYNNGATTNKAGASYWTAARINTAKQKLLDASAGGLLTNAQVRAQLDSVS